MAASRRSFLGLLGAAGVTALAARAASAPDSTQAAVLLSKNKLADAYPASPPAGTGLGPAAALAYCGPVYAPDRREWYRIAEGGHNTGLNHVIAFNERTGLYRLVAPPAPLCTGPDIDIVVGRNADGTARTVKAKELAPDPVNGWGSPRYGRTWAHPTWGAPSGHDYGGAVCYSTKARKFFRVTPPESWPINVGYWPEFWQFDPDTAGGANHGWTKLADAPKELFPAMVGMILWEAKDGKIGFLSGSEAGFSFAAYDPATNSWGSPTKITGTKFGYGTGFYDPSDDVVYVHGFDDFYAATISPPSFRKLAHRAMRFWHSHPCVSHGAWIWSWNPTDGMLRLNKKTGQWQQLPSVKPPFYDFVYGAVRVDGGSFVVDAGPNGVWSFPIPPEDAGWVNVEPHSAIPAQSYIDKAAAGGEVTIPPGYYADALVIKKPLTVRLKGVNLLGTAQGKANIVVATTGKVRIYDHECLGVSGDPSAAAVRDSGVAVDLELYNVHYANCPNGILIGNALESKLLVDGGLIERMTGNEFSHGIYFGLGQTLTLRNLTIKGDGIAQLFGHLCKSRATTTLIERTCTLTGGDGHYSRLVDLPCGGDASLAGRYAHGPNADNADCFSYATEPTNCRDGSGTERCSVPGSFTFNGTLATHRAKTIFGVYRGAKGTVVRIDKSGLPVGLPLGTFPA